MSTHPRTDEFRANDEATVRPFRARLDDWQDHAETLEDELTAAQAELAVRRQGSHEEACRE